VRLWPRRLAMIRGNGGLHPSTKLDFESPNTGRTLLSLRSASSIFLGLEVSLLSNRVHVRLYCENGVMH